MGSLQVRSLHSPPRSLICLLDFFFLLCFLLLLLNLSCGFERALEVTGLELNGLISYPGVNIRSDTSHTVDF